MSVTDELLEHNDRYAQSFDKGDLPLPPAKRLAVLACIDARLDVHKILGLGRATPMSSATPVASRPTT
jgi:carbonic anhydrase